jgi:cyanophycinase
MAETTPRVVGLRGATPRGWLMICGGGVRDEHERMYRDFFALADKADASPVGEGGASGKRTTRIGVVPTATGAESRGGDTLELLRRYAEGREVVMVPLFKEDLGKGDDASIAELIASCDGLWFVGGDQSRITAVFRPDGRDTLAYRATLRVLARGGVIAGTSAGAAMMTDPMITGGTSEDALEHGVAWTNDVQEGQGVGLAPGMGYLQGVLVDQHFLERGRLGRLIVAMHATGTTRAFGVGEDAAFVVDLARGEGFSIGPSKGPTAGWCGVVEVQRQRARQAIMFGGSH